MRPIGKPQAVLIATMIIVPSFIVGVFLLSQVQGPFYVWGNVTVGYGLTNGTISVVDEQGVVIVQEDGLTDAGGSFIMEIPFDVHSQLLSETDFEIIVTNGFLDEQPFSGTLRIDVSRYEAFQHLSINELTTLATNLRKVYSLESYLDACLRVKAFYNIPETARFSTWSIQVLENYSSYDFLDASSAFTSFDEYVDQLTPLVQNTPSAVLSGVAGEFIGAGLKGIGMGVSSEVGGMIGKQIGGWVMSSVFGIKSAQQKMQDQLKEVNKKLDQMSKQLDKIQQGVTKLEHGQAVIENLLSQLANEITAEAYRTQLVGERSTLLGTLTSPIASITSSYDSLIGLSIVNLTSSNYQLYQTQVQNQLTSILDPNTGIHPRLLTISQTIGPSILTDDTLINVWAKIAASGISDSDSLESTLGTMLSRFSYLIGMELKGINVYIEALHATYGNDTSLASEFWDQWSDTLIEQVAEFTRSVERLVATRTDVLSGSDIIGFPILQEIDAFQYEVSKGFTNDVVDVDSDFLFLLRGNNGMYVARSGEGYLEASATTSANAVAFRAVGLGGSHIALQTSTGDYLHVDSNGRIQSVPSLLYICNQDNGHIQLFSRNLTSLGSFHVEEEYPFDIVVDSDEYCYLATADGILKLNSHHVERDVWSTDYSCGISLGSDGYLYVLGEFSEIVKKYTRSGHHVATWGASGTGDGEFSGPSDIAVDIYGNVYVADSGNNRIQVFDENGNFIRKWGVLGTGDYDFDDPISVDTDVSGNLYVADSNNHRILKYDAHGYFMMDWTVRWGEELASPTRIEVNSFGDVFVGLAYEHDRENMYALISYNANGDIIASMEFDGDGMATYDGLYYDFQMNEYADNFYTLQLSNGKYVGIDHDGFLSAENITLGSSSNFTITQMSGMVTYRLLNYPSISHQSILSEGIDIGIHDGVSLYFPMNSTDVADQTYLYYDHNSHEHAAIAIQIIRYRFEVASGNYTTKHYYHSSSELLSEAALQYIIRLVEGVSYQSICFLTYGHT